MSLRSTNINKAKKFSLKETKLPAPESKKIEQPKIVSKPPTKEEVVYNTFLAINPNIKILIKTFDLVSLTTGEQINKVNIESEIQETSPEIKEKLKLLATKIMSNENNDTKENIIENIVKSTGVSKERALNGFNLMLESGVIKQTFNNDSYYLENSTPF